MLLLLRWRVCLAGRQSKQRLEIVVGDAKEGQQMLGRNGCAEWPWWGCTVCDTVSWSIRTQACLVPRSELSDNFVK